MSTLTVTNWFGDIVSHPKVIVDAESVEDILAVMKDPAKYPSPVRAVGSNHSTSACGVAEGGTLIRMKMNRILSIGSDTLTVEAGATHINIARELQKHNLQFYVNTEIGSLTAGSAACAGTKDSSMPGEYGQVGSYITGLKMVLPSGELLEIREDKDADLLCKVRSSYGTFGVVYEVTYRVRPLTRLAVHHKTYSLAKFQSTLKELIALDYSMMYYTFPFENKITVEFRKYNPSASGDSNRIAWALRNHTWGVTGPKFAHSVGESIADKHIRYGIIDASNAAWRFQLENIVVSDNTLLPDQIIEYPPVSNDSRYTFSLFAFPEEQFAERLGEFFQFCQDYYKQKGYRSDLLYVGYRILQDRNAWLSYSWNGNVMTIDPVSTGNPGWTEYVDAYNDWCIARNGIPLLNQTDGLTPAQLKKALGDRLAVFEHLRQEFDPAGRLLNAYFKNLFSVEVAAKA